MTGDREKALHHTISSAAALKNWHEAIMADTSGAGIGRDDDLRPRDPLPELTSLETGEGDATA